MLHRFRSRVRLAAVMPLCCVSALFAGQTESRPSKAFVAMRIQGRQDAIRSARFSWTQECFEAKGARLDPGEAGDNALPTSSSLPGPKSAVPYGDVEYTLSFSFAFDGAKTNFLSEQRVHDDSNQAHVIRTRRTFDGQSQQSLRQPWGDYDYPCGTIYKDAGLNRDLGLLVLEPILQCYRLFRPETGSRQRGGFQIENTEIDVHGDKTVSVSVRTSDLRRVLSLDPARDYLPVRYSLESGNQIQRQTDFEYRLDDQVGWVLSGWTITKFSPDGAVSHRFTATVRDSEINPPLEPAEFEVTFPPGTLVDDLKDGAGYILRADGSRRRIARSEFRKSYEELLKTEPDVIPASGIRLVVVLANIVVLTMAAVVFAARWARRGGGGGQ